jgi:hypothetical protein
MINKMNKERPRSMNATPARPRNKNHLQGTQEDPKQKQDGARESTVWLITKMIQNDKYKEIMVTYKEIKIKENK